MSFDSPNIHLPVHRFIPCHLQCFQWNMHSWGKYFFPVQPSSKQSSALSKCTSFLEERMGFASAFEQTKIFLWFPKVINPGLFYTELANNPESEMEIPMTIKPWFFVMSKPGQCLWGISILCTRPEYSRKSPAFALRQKLSVNEPQLSNEVLFVFLFVGRSICLG